MKGEDVDCSRYSRVMDGAIRLRESQRRTSFLPQDMSDKKWFIFNMVSKRFDPCMDISTVCTGYYYILDYSLIDRDLYVNIIATRRTQKSKRAAILAGGKSVFFLVNNDVKLSYTDVKDKLRITLNGITIEEAINNSSDIPYYDELVDDFEYFKQIFINDRRYIDLQENELFSGRFTFAEMGDVMFFNKGILVADIWGLSCMLPAAYKIKAVLNYKKHGLKLDVSRNRIIGGRQEIEKELTSIILKHLKTKENDPAILAMLSAMISTLENS